LESQQGQQQTRTEWHKIVIFGKLTQIVESYLDKGSKIYIEGQLRTRKWQNQQGQDQYTTEVVLTQFKGSLQMLDTKPSNESNTQLSNRRIATVVDDEIPF